jgi:hypothetical protein
MNSNNDTSLSQFRASATFLLRTVRNKTLIVLMCPKMTVEGHIQTVRSSHMSLSSVLRNAVGGKNYLHTRRKRDFPPPVFLTETY